MFGGLDVLGLVVSRHGKAPNELMKVVAMNARERAGGTRPRAPGGLAGGDPRQAGGLGAGRGVGNPGDTGGPADGAVGREGVEPQGDGDLGGLDGDLAPRVSGVADPRLASQVMAFDGDPVALMQRRAGCSASALVPGSTGPGRAPRVVGSKPRNAVGRSVQVDHSGLTGGQNSQFAYWYVPAGC
jgi:hypothetical protein